MQKLPSLENAKNLKGKRVLLRLDFNVPLKGGRVVDGYRIKCALPTIKFLKSQGAKTIIISHIGSDGEKSLRPVARYLNKKMNVGFYPKLESRDLPNIISAMKHGGVMMLENLRKDPGELKNDMNFAKRLAVLGDVYVNDAFSVSHRDHASVVLLPKLLPSYAGFLFEDEVSHLSRALRPSHPFLFILGGAKFGTKIPLIKKFLRVADRVFVGGALANNFFKEAGYEIGTSLSDNGNFKLKPLFKNKKLIVPSDVIVKTKTETLVKDIGSIRERDSIKDVGPKTIREIKNVVSRAKFILWNGPLGNYEEGFDKGTIDLLKIIAKSKAESIVGGGDSLALISKLGFEKKFTFVSTGGGAMLDFLANGTLPGIKALLNSKKKL
ncbi:MAG: phosphoglycerate kinase [bacterium]|nr:phosphoglycerate kinase [bacterium]